MFYIDEVVAGDLVSALAATGLGTSLRRMEIVWRFNDGVMAQRLADIFYQGACPALRELKFTVQHRRSGDTKTLEESLAGRARVLIYR